MMDRDLAELYGVENKRLNEQVKRNIERFPEQFRFQLTKEERNELVANCDRFESLKHSTVLPHVFTEQGVSMLSAVLRSATAIKVSIQIMDAFVGMRKFIGNNAAIFQRLDSIEQKQYLTDTKLDQVFEASLKRLCHNCAWSIMSSCPIVSNGCPMHASSRLNRKVAKRIWRGAEPSEMVRGLNRRLHTLKAIRRAQSFAVYQYAQRNERASFSFVH